MLACCFAIHFKRLNIVSQEATANPIPTMLLLLPWCSWLNVIFQRHQFKMNEYLWSRKFSLVQPFHFISWLFELNWRHLKSMALSLTHTLTHSLSSTPKDFITNIFLCARHSMLILCTQNASRYDSQFIHNIIKYIFYCKTLQVINLEIVMLVAQINRHHFSLRAQWGTANEKHTIHIALHPLSRFQFLHENRTWMNGC